MITQLNNFALNLIKSNLSIVLIFYAGGFLSSVAYYRVLGIPNISSDIQTYAELAGKDALIILQTFIFLVTKPDYFIFNHYDTSWASSWIHLWLLAIFVLLILNILFKILSYFHINFIKDNYFVIRFQFIIIVLIVITSFHIETQALYAKNVLQTSDFSQLYQQKQNISVYEKEINRIDYEKRAQLFSDFNQNNSKTSSYFFAIPEKKDISGNDKRRLNALMLIILMTTATIMTLIIYREHEAIQWLLFFFTIAQMILIPFNCGILGATYQYPVISLSYSEKDKVVQKEAVFLLAKSQDNLIIYDRLNFFQIDYIPQGSVINMHQIFTSSPFSNCGNNGDFKPCELYALKQ